MVGLKCRVGQVTGNMDIFFCLKRTDGNDILIIACIKPYIPWCYFALQAFSNIHLYGERVCCKACT